MANKNLPRPFPFREQESMNLPGKEDLYSYHEFDNDYDDKEDDDDYGEEDMGYEM